MKVSEEFDQFAEEIVDRLKAVPFKDLNGFEGREYTWRKGRKEGCVFVSIEIISHEYKRVTIEGMLLGRIFWSQKLPFRKRFRAYESGVRVPELLD